MSSSLFQNNQAGQNPIQMLAEFQKFKKSMQGKNPQAIVEEMLKNGQMSSAQFEELKRQAVGLAKILR